MDIKFTDEHDKNCDQCEVKKNLKTDCVKSRPECEKDSPDSKRNTKYNCFDFGSYKPGTCPLEEASDCDSNCDQCKARKKNCIIMRLLLILIWLAALIIGISLTEYFADTYLAYDVNDWNIFDGIFS